ncbi:MAG: hypothetical protein OQK75_12085 [Gammaproteobacteria bacterium]|nr:hypothetical protein [Gammaproteobacteria bacterium]MCW8988395.1 hypothetical protein [Gammaproteobacteria bacterium]
MRKPVEIIEGDKSLRLNLYLIIASFLLLIISVEPVIDFVLLMIYGQSTPFLIEYINKVKLIASTIIYTVIGLIPAFYASWFGFRVLASSKLPPVLLSGKTRFPFTVVVIKGKHAKMFGVLIIIISVVLIIQLFLYAIKVLLI